MVENNVDDLAFTTHCRPKSEFDFDEWTYSQSTLPQLMTQEPPVAITAPSTNINSD